MKPLVDVEFRFVPRYVVLEQVYAVDTAVERLEHVLQVRKCRTNDAGTPVWTEWQEVPVLDDAVEVR